MKTNLLEEIRKKIKKRKANRTAKAQGNVIESYVFDFIQKVEDINAIADSHQTWDTLVRSAANTLGTKLYLVDNYVNWEISWHESESALPRVNGVLIKWSSEFQTINKVEPELFIDATALLFI